MKKKLGMIIILIIVMMIASSCKKSEDEVPSGINLLTNGDFSSDIWEDWKKDIWIDDEWITQIEAVDDDGNAVMIINNDENDAKIKQTVSVETNTYYKLSGYIKAENIRDGAAANLSFENIFVYAGNLTDTDGEYQYVEVYGKTSNKQKSLTVFVRLGGYSLESIGIAYFKDIRLEKVDDIPSDAEVYELEEVKQTKNKTEEDDIGKEKFEGWMMTICLIYLLWFIIARRRYKDVGLYNKDTNLFWYLFICILLIGTIIRIFVAVKVVGYPNDMACWQAWSYLSAENGLVNLYDGSVFIDYPPGYMYILYALGWLMKIPGLDKASQLIVKMPSIITDIILSIMIFKLAEKSFNKRAGLMLAAFYFLSPAIITDSAAWGQIDSILAIMVIWYILRLYKNDFVLAGIILAVGTLLKPQMLLFAPVYLVAAFYYGRDNGFAKGIKKFFYGFIAGCGAFFLIVLPFQIRYGFNFIFNLYWSTLSSYESMSLNACNLWGLIGGMWADIGKQFGPLTFGQWGNIGLIVAVLTYLGISFFDKDKKNIFYNAAVLIVGIYLLAGKMHERYMFAAMALLLVSYILTKKRSHLWLFILFTIVQFTNISLVLVNEYIFHGDTWTVAISLATIFGYMSMLMGALVNIYQLEYEEELEETELKSEKRNVIEKKTAANLKGNKYKGLFASLGKKDYIIMGIVTLVYTIVAFINLGNNYGSETMWEADTRNQEIIVDFGEDVEIDRVMFFRVLATNGAYFSVEYAADGSEDDYVLKNFFVIGESSDYDDEDGEQKKGFMESEFTIDKDTTDESLYTFSTSHAVLKWIELNSNTTARYARIIIGRPTIRISELGFMDSDNNVIPIEKVQIINGDENNENSPMLMFDEQDMIPEHETFMNSTYFDEIYHARTAWEHLMYIEPYETTHPPLGKVIMSLGIKIFGLNPFGWRFMGTIVGILMVPLMYLIGMVLFEKTHYAAITMLLMTFDFMHFAQTRIATIDSYGVFFIILMYLCMGIYYKMNFYKHKFVHTLIPLGLSGLFFGLGAASKWICIYAGAGLAVIFFYTLFMRLKEYNYVKNSDDDLLDGDLKRTIETKFVKYTVITLLLCVVFFIIIPCIVYCMSYIPILKIEDGRGLEYIIQNQVNMYNYHSGLTAGHGFASPWYEWPFIIKPIWYYSGYTGKGLGYMASIASFGNPAVWWIGTCALIYLLLNTIIKRNPSKVTIFLLIGFASQFLPWVLVPRSMFIYHYFASVPFVIMMIVVLIRKLESNKWFRKEYTYLYIGIVIILFIMFYPVLSGMTIPSSYGKLLKWLPTWWFIS